MKLKENYSGSIAILLVGCLYFALELYGVESEHTLGGILSGTGIILAAIAYRSAKRRRIYISEPTTFRIGLESVLILTSIFLLFMFSVGDVMFFTYQPLTSIVWLGSIAAYIFMVFGSRTNDVITYKSNANDGEKKISIETPNLIADSKPQLDINKSKNFFIKFKETISGESNISVSATEFFGSSAAIVLGVLYFLSGVNVAAQKTGGSANGLVFGLVIILGALAYKSAKKRKLNIVATTVIREIFEIVAILLILASVLMLNVDIKKFMAETPVSFLIWLWALIPYFIMVFSIRNKKYENTKATSKEVDKSVESPVLDTTSNPPLKGPLEGLGGWLILIGFNVVVTPLKQLLDFNKSYDEYTEALSRFFSSDMMTLMFSGEKPDALHLFLVILLEFSVGLIIIFLLTYLAYLFFSKKTGFPGLFIKIYIGILIYSVIDMYATSLLPIAMGGGVIDKESWTQIAGMTFFTVVWVMYMLKSVRVKATFVN